MSFCIGNVQWCTADGVKVAARVQRSAGSCWLFELHTFQGFIVRTIFIAMRLDLAMLGLQVAPYSQTILMVVHVGSYCTNLAADNHVDDLLPYNMC